MINYNCLTAALRTNIFYKWLASIYYFILFYIRDDDIEEVDGRGRDKPDLAHPVCLEVHAKMDKL